MRNPIRLVRILLLFILSGSLNAQHVLVAGVNRLSNCQFATRPLLADLQAVRFPTNWTIVVTCNRLVWEWLQRHSDAQATRTGFTNLEGRITVLNGELYLKPLPLAGTAHRTPRLVLQHERGHIVCGCEEEWRADRAAEIE